VSARNVEIARQLNAAFNNSDVAALLELLDPEIEWSDRTDDPGATVCRGHEAFMQRLVELAADIDGLRVEAKEFIAHGDHVVVPVRVSGRGRASGAVFEAHEVHVVRIRAGRTTELREYHDLDEALAAVAPGG
jgi:ketosteroid isomerase-like protein